MTVMQWCCNNHTLSLFSMQLSPTWDFNIQCKHRMVYTVLPLDGIPCLVIWW